MAADWQRAPVTWQLGPFYWLQYIVCTNSTDRFSSLPITDVGWSINEPHNLSLHGAATGNCGSELIWLLAADRKWKRLFRRVNLNARLVERGSPPSSRTSVIRELPFLTESHTLHLHTCTLPHAPRVLQQASLGKTKMSGELYEAASGSSYEDHAEHRHMLLITICVHEYSNDNSLRYLY